MPAHPELIAHNVQFKKKLHQLTSTVFTAVGYAASNVHFLIGATGIVVIDTTETTQAAANILADFRKISNLPITTIIYTHSHRDHISGATVFAEKQDVEVIAADNFTSDLVNVDNSKPAPNAALITRTKRHFGISLDHDERVNIGIGPGDRPMIGLGAGYVAPTLRISKTTSLTREGFSLELAKAPGETPDHIVVWLTSERILFCGDNYYHAFPNLYAIRGTAYRDFDAWADTIDQLLNYNADILAPGHTTPIVGNELITEALTDYRDAIRHVIVATVKGMNEGLDPLTIAANLELPSKLANKPYLQEYYGHIGYASRAYFGGTLGWFDGNPTSLAQLPPATEAIKFIELAGGAESLLATARKALDNQEWQWTLELVDRLIAADVDALKATDLKIQALRKLADLTVNAPTRNYYLLCARELAET